MLDGNDVSPSAFNMMCLQNGYETYVSVLRADYLKITRKYAQKIRPRVKEDCVSGYAELSAGEVRDVKTENISVDVKDRKSVV